MAVPTHELSCVTIAWPTNCPDCAKAVFFFACTCGSKVFFDALGDPWPKHHESCRANHIRLLRDAEGLSLEEVENLIRRQAERLGMPVPDDVATLFRTLSYRETGHATPLRLRPDDEDREFVGTIASIDPHVNFYKRFKYVKNDRGRAFLGSLASEEYVEVKLNGNVDPTTGFRPYVEAYMTARRFRKAGLVVGQRVRVMLHPHVMLDKTKIWMIVEVFDGDD